MEKQNTLAEIGTALKIGKEIGLISNPKGHVVGCSFALQEINKAIMDIAPEAILFSDEERGRMHEYAILLQTSRGVPGIQSWLSNEMCKRNFPERIVDLSMAFARYCIDIWASNSNPDAPFVEASDDDLKELEALAARFKTAGGIAPDRIQ